jgi:hypothetical protein
MNLHLGIRLGGQPGGASAAGPLLVNGDFSNGTTGWTIAQGGGTLTVVGGWVIENALVLRRLG